MRLSLKFSRETTYVSWQAGNLHSILSDVRRRNAANMYPEAAAPRPVRTPWHFPTRHRQHQCYSDSLKSEPERCIHRVPPARQQIKDMSKDGFPNHCGS